MGWIAKPILKESAHCKLCKCDISFKLKSFLKMTKQPSEISEPRIILTPVNSMSVAGSISSNTSYLKSVDTCFQNSIC